MIKLKPLLITTLILISLIGLMTSIIMFITWEVIALAALLVCSALVFISIYRAVVYYYDDKNHKQRL